MMQTQVETAPHHMASIDISHEETANRYRRLCMQQSVMLAFGHFVTRYESAGVCYYLHAEPKPYLGHIVAVGCAEGGAGISPGMHCSWVRSNINTFAVL